MRVIGIDIGSKNVGVAVLDVDGSPAARPRLVDAVLCRATSDDLATRLLELHTDLLGVLSKHKTAGLVIGVEEPFVHRERFMGVIQVGAAFGVALLAAQQATAMLSGRVVRLSPASVKKAATGSGVAKKKHVARCVVALLGLDEAPESMDVSDAIAVALTAAGRA